MSYLLKTLLKEAKDVLNKCGTDGYAALQLFHLHFHHIHFLFQINEYCIVPVQGNKKLPNKSVITTGILKIGF